MRSVASILVIVSTETAQVFTALLTLVAGAGAIGLVVLRLLAAGGNEGAARLGRAVSEAGVWLAFLVALTSMLGSLYFSEVADFVPCRLCWFQRIAMYPLVAILLVGALRRDEAVRWYVAPIAAAGALVAGYHYLIEWEVVEDNTCSLTGPSCAAVWFREFGFISLALMALVGFLTILALLFVRFPATMDEADESPPSTPARQEVAS